MSITHQTGLQGYKEDHVSSVQRAGTDLAPTSESKPDQDI